MGHPCLSLQFFEKWRLLYVHSSTFNVSVYTPYHTTRLVCYNGFTGKMATEHRESSGSSSPGLVEKIPREAMDSMLRKLSMIVHTAKAACNKTRGWTVVYFWPCTREIAIRSCKFTLSVLLGMNYSCEKLSYCSSKQNFI